MKLVRGRPKPSHGTVHDLVNHETKTTLNLYSKENRTALCSVNAGEASKAFNLNVTFRTLA